MRALISFSPWSLPTFIKLDTIMSAARLIITRKCAKQLLLRNAIPSISMQHTRNSSQYFPIDDKIFGLTEEQQQVQIELCFADYLELYVYSITHLFCSLGKLCSILFRRNLLLRQRRLTNPITFQNFGWDELFLLIFHLLCKPFYHLYLYANMGVLFLRFSE